MPKGKQAIFGRSRPSYACELKMRRQLQDLVAEMKADTEKEVRSFFRSMVITDAADDGDDTTEKKPFNRTRLLAVIRARWYERFEKRGREIIVWMAMRANSRTRAQIKKKLRILNWIREPEYTDEHRAAVRAIAAAGVSYIKSIPQKYLRNVQETVAEYYERGMDRAYLKDTIEEMYEKLGTAGDRADSYAALVARDQSNKITQNYAIINAMAYGATRGRWIHVPGIKSARITHKAMDRKEFFLADGMYDEDVEDYVHPGELPYCQCQFEVLMPGFED